MLSLLFADQDQQSNNTVDYAQRAFLSSVRLHISTMTDIHDLEANLIETSQSLKNYQRDIKALQKNPDLATWFSFSLKAYSKVLKEFGLSMTDLIAAKQACVVKPKEIVKQIAPLANEIGNLLIDLKDHSDLSITKRAKKIEEKHQQIIADIKLFEKQAQKLTQTKKDFLANLQVEHFFSITKATIKTKKGVYESGQAMYNFIFADKNAPNTLKSLITKCENLELRFKTIKIPHLPYLADEVVHHYIDLSAKTANNLSYYLNNTEANLASEIATKSLISKKLVDLREETSIAEVFNKAQKLTFSISELFLGLASHKKILDEINLVSETIEQLDVLHLTLKNSLLNQLVSHTSEPGAKLNPQTFAYQNTKAFFFGLKGVVRSLKLIISTFKGNEAFNEVELRLILEKAINTCRIFYGSSVSDIQKLQKFIDNLLNKYARPFPYKQLFKLVKNTLSEYGNEVEKFIYSFAIEEKYRSSRQSIIPATCGRLVENIEKYDTHLAKLLK